eukprot:614019-Prymnesium_polylepis.1
MPPVHKARRQADPEPAPAAAQRAQGCEDCEESEADGDAADDAEEDADAPDIPLERRRRRKKDVPSPLRGRDGAPQPAADGPRKRRRAAPQQSGSPGGSGAFRKRKKSKVREEVEAVVEDEHFVGSARATTENAINLFLCPKCKEGELGPRSPTRPRGSASICLRFTCKECGAEHELATGAQQRLYTHPKPSADSDDEDGEEQPKRKQQRRTATDTMLLVLGTVFGGGNYGEYEQQCSMLGIKAIHEDTWQEKIYLIARHAEWVANESVRVLRYLIARYGNVHELIVTSDTFWHHRGHYSPSGTGTICDEGSGGVLAFMHTCKHTDKAHSKEEAYQGTSGSMDAYQFKGNLESVIKWIDEEVPELLEKYGVELPSEDDKPAVTGVVLDGDASTSYQMQALQEKAAGINEYDCANHLAKNCGNDAYKIGHTWHTKCSCR